MHIYSLLIILQKIKYLIFVVVQKNGSSMRPSRISSYVLLIGIAFICLSLSNGTQGKFLSIYCINVIIWNVILVKYQIVQINIPVSRQVLPWTEQNGMQGGMVILFLHIWARIVLQTMTVKLFMNVVKNLDIVCLIGIGSLFY